ncbi:diguanylate cyclase [Frankia sp. CNm7]|uniref:Diguanylate cyclase n=2 Tax=Frankia nepalensis TaxID=1836974 RepID=A0A937UW09_9ACTN|nr:diguanylate cyclase [Frankia nepalensis]MBL7514408.1 diguanylate cyclase [Frankia nepalensis]MBL7518352.1 diguanylate cyclase [Frankia nepalensis]MBL7632881.1 diguanylate cyclase [Frankia nepalensis]
MGPADLFDILRTGLVVAGVDDNRVHRANAAACQLVGRSEAEYVGMHWHDLVDPTQLDELQATAEAYVAAGGPHGERRFARILRPDGTIVHLMMSVSMVTIDGERCFLTQMQDITELVSTQRQLQLVIENTPVSVFLLDQEGRLGALDGAVRQTPAAARDAAASSVFHTFRHQEAVRGIVRRSLGGERVHEVLHLGRRWYDIHLVPVPGLVGQPSPVAGVLSDVTEREQATAELLVRTTRQTALADLAQHALEIVDERALWDLGVRTLTDQLGADLVTLCAQPGPDQEPDAPVVATDILAARPALATSTPAGALSAQPGGPGRDRAAPGADVRTDEAGGTAPTVVRLPVGHADEPSATITVRRAERGLTSDDVAFIRSVAAILGSAVLRIRMEEAARFRSLHDPLTGLPNRVAVLDRLRRSLCRTRRDARRTGVLFIDLDGFKAVNDALGHQAGDDLLRAVAGRFCQVVRPGDLVGRLAGDEFAVLCESVTGLDDLRSIGERAIRALAPPVQLVRPVSVGASVGLALAGPGLTDAEQLLDAADVAMYEAKRREPGSCVAYNDTIRVAVTTRLRDITDLRRAVAAVEMRLLFRPVADRRGAVVAAEAIPCWPHPTGCLLGPEDIEPIAFEAGLTGDLDRWLVDNTLGLTETSTTTPPPDTPAHVDAQAGDKAAGHVDGSPRELWIRVSDRGLADTALRETIIKHLPHPGPSDGRGPIPCVLVPDRLWHRDHRHVNTIIREFADAGVAVRLDFTEMGPLRAMNRKDVPPGLSGIRLSCQHVHGVEQDGIAAAILAGIVRFADLLHLNVAVRGVDTPAQLAAVRALGCDLAQGAAVGEALPTPPW